MSVPRNKLGFPTSMRSTLRYSEIVKFSPGADQKTEAWSYGINDLYDPLVNLGGHQPRGFSEYTDLYETYTVSKARITVNWMYKGYDGPAREAAGAGALAQQVDVTSTAVPAVSPAICGIHKSNISTYVPELLNDQLEKDRTTWTVINPQSACRTSSASSDLVEFFGKKNLIAAEGYSGTTGATGFGKSPDTMAFFHVFCARGSDDPASNSGVMKVSAIVTIEYDAVFTDPKPLDAS